MSEDNRPYKIDIVDYLAISFFVWCFCFIITVAWVFILGIIFKIEASAIAIEVSIIYSTILTAIQMIRNFKIKE